MMICFRCYAADQSIIGGREMLIASHYAALSVEHGAHIVRTRSHRDLSRHACTPQPTFTWKQCSRPAKNEWGIPAESFALSPRSCACLREAPTDDEWPRVEEPHILS